MNDAIFIIKGREAYCKDQLFGKEKRGDLVKNRGIFSCRYPLKIVAQKIGKTIAIKLGRAIMYKTKKAVSNSRVENAKGSPGRKHRLPAPGAALFMNLFGVCVPRVLWVMLVFPHMRIPTML